MAKKRKQPSIKRLKPPGYQAASTSIKIEPAGLSKEPAYIVALWFIGGALAFWAFGYGAIKGSDLWWHIAGGEYIVRHLGLPATDPWSFTAADRHWVADAWLSDVILYLWAKAFGMASLVWWKWLVITGTFMALMRLLWRLTGSLPAAFLAAFLAAATAAPFMDIRPQIISLLGLVILLDMTLKRDRVSPALVPLFFLWANLHAGFTLGLLMLPILLVPFLRERATRKRTAAIAAASALVCLANPNGIHAFTQPILYALDTHSPFRSIAEWLPPFEKGGVKSSLYPYALGAFGFSVLIGLGLGAKARQRMDWRFVAVGLLTLAMSLTSRRFISSFAIGQSLLLATVLAEAALRIPWHWSRVALPSAAVATGVLLLFPYPQRTYAFEYLTGEYTFPTATVDMMNASGLSGNVFAYYNWGGFLHLKTQGRLKVYIDGRASAVFKAGTYLNYARVEGVARGWVGIVEGSGASYFLWPRNLPRQLASLKQTGHWKSVYTDANSELLVRKGYPLPTPLKDPPATVFSAMRGCIALMETGRLADAEACARRLRDQSPTSFLPYNMLIQVQINQGKPEDARATLESLQRIFPLPEYADQVDRLIRSRTKS